jgi:hypothetical protein
MLLDTYDIPCVPMPPLAWCDEAIAPPPLPLPRPSRRRFLCRGRTCAARRGCSAARQDKARLLQWRKPWEEAAGGSGEQGVTASERKQRERWSHVPCAWESECPRTKWRAAEDGDGKHGGVGWKVLRVECQSTRTEMNRMNSGCFFIHWSQVFIQVGGRGNSRPK